MTSNYPAGQEDIDNIPLESQIVCDNVDCLGDGIESKEVKMREEFEGDIVYWCDSCIKRDSQFIDEEYEY